MLAFLGVSFLTPLDSLFVLAAAVPLAALLLTERRADAVRRLLALRTPGRYAFVPLAVALFILPALVAVAAAQPVVVRPQKVAERADAEAFIVLDTSLSMKASRGAGKPTRLTRAKRIAARLQHSLADVPTGLATMTDRALPTVMPTTDGKLFDRALQQSVAINQPPPSLPYYFKRASTFEALVPLVGSRLYAAGVQRRLLIVLTDGEASAVSPLLKVTLQRRVTPVYVHVWQPGERIWTHGRPDPHYVSDPSSGHALDGLASITSGSTFAESDVRGAERAARDAVGRAGTRTHVAAYARTPLAPWFVLAGVLPLAFLLWRRNA
jgi:hypothetical protein